MVLKIGKPHNLLAWANISIAVSTVGFIHVVASIKRDAQLLIYAAAILDQFEEIVNPTEGCDC